MSEIKIVITPPPAIKVLVTPPVPVKIVKVGTTLVVQTVDVASKIVFGETPAGLINGSNATFTTALNFVPGKVVVYINGLLQKLVTHYNTSGTNTIIFNDSPLASDLIEVDYIKQ